MRTKARPTIDEIAKASGVSRATVDRVLHQRPGVDPRTRDLIHGALIQLEQAYSQALLPASRQTGTKRRFGLIIQAGQAFSRSLMAMLEGQRNGDSSQLESHSCESETTMIDMIRRLGEELDGIAIICKNVTPLIIELQRIRNAGKPVLAVVSDLERSARSAYLGIDNRAAGQMAAYLLGRHLEYRIDASVAVVVGNVSYRCHEDREIGFRSLLRQKFSNIELLEVVGNDSSEIAYDATLKLFATKPNLAGLYNVAGGNRGLAQALSDMKLTYHPIYITHELNQVTEPLLRAERIDYLITQDLDKLLHRTKRLLQEAGDESRDLQEVNHLPIRLLTQFHLNSD
jgi:LacI family transcriptional regulator, galactose operon repressor